MTDERQPGWTAFRRRRPVTYGDNPPNHILINAVTEDALDKYILGQRNAGLRKATINRRLKKLRQAFRLGIRRKKITRMPVFELLREDNVREGFFEHDEFLSLLDACADEDLKDFWSVAYYIGWRKAQSKR